MPRTLLPKKCPVLLLFILLVLFIRCGATVRLPIYDELNSRAAIQNPHEIQQRSASSFAEKQQQQDGHTDEPNLDQAEITPPKQKSKPTVIHVPLEHLRGQGRKITHSEDSQEPKRVKQVISARDVDAFEFNDEEHDEWYDGGYDEEHHQALNEGDLPVEYYQHRPSYTSSINSGNNHLNGRNPDGNFVCQNCKPCRCPGSTAKSPCNCPHKAPCKCPPPPRCQCPHSAASPPTDSRPPPETTPKIVQLCNCQTHNFLHEGVYEGCFCVRPDKPLSPTNQQKRDTIPDPVSYAYDNEDVSSVTENDVLYVRDPKDAGPLRPIFAFKAPRDSIPIPDEDYMMADHAGDATLARRFAEPLPGKKGSDKGKTKPQGFESSYRCKGSKCKKQEHRRDMRQEVDVTEDHGKRGLHMMEAMWDEL